MVRTRKQGISVKAKQQNYKAKLTLCSIVLVRLGESQETETRSDIPQPVHVHLNGKPAVCVGSLSGKTVVTGACYMPMLARKYARNGARNSSLMGK